MSIRVYELAKEIKVSSSELMKKLKEKGLGVENHFATLDDDAINFLKNEFMGVGDETATVSKPNISERKKKSELKQKDEPKDRSVSDEIN